MKVRNYDVITNFRNYVTTLDLKHHSSELARYLRLSQCLEAVSASYHDLK
jgi:hypothetical protein